MGTPRPTSHRTSPESPVEANEVSLAGLVLVEVPGAEGATVGTRDADGTVVEVLVVGPPEMVKGAVNACGPVRKALL